MSRKTVREAIRAPDGALAYERGQFGVDPVMSGFCFDMDIGCWRKPISTRLIEAVSTH